MLSSIAGALSEEAFIFQAGSAQIFSSVVE